jgi:hypothetical protein
MYEGQNAHLICRNYFSDAATILGLLTGMPQHLGHLGPVPNPATILQDAATIFEVPQLFFYGPATFFF